jgi:hypothetical protein
MLRRQKFCSSNPTDLLGYSSFTVVGQAVGNLMNMEQLWQFTQVYAKKGTPFIWPGSKAQWNGISDVTDAKILAKHFIWAATTPKAENLAFNVVNGDIFRLELAMETSSRDTLELNIKALWKTIVTWKSCKMMTPFGENY